jgi:DNA-binding GntR family transcriptional regulator
MVMQLIMRGSLRDEIVDRLRSLVVTGELAPGGRINESILSRELGVSRTPLREALLLLVGEGLVVCEPARGFVASPLTVAQAREVFPILAALEVLALRSGGGVALHKLDHLLGLHADYQTATGPTEARSVDEQWHALLTSGCSNGALQEQLSRWRSVERRYSLATSDLNGSWPHPPLVFQHEAVMEAIDAGDLDEACAALERHWTSATRPLLSALARSIA